MVKCAQCQKDFEATRKWSRFCSTACRRAFTRTAYKNTAYFGLPALTVGEISELRAATDLLIKGYEVFRALSQHCSCDLIVLKHDRLLRIEVRTGYVSKASGTKYVPVPKEKRCDVLCMVFPDSIEYVPALDRLPPV